MGRGHEGIPYSNRDGKKLCMYMNDLRFSNKLNVVHVFSTYDYYRLICTRTDQNHS